MRTEVPTGSMSPASTQALRTDYRLAFVSPWPSWNSTVEGSETEASEMKESKMSHRHFREMPFFLQLPAQLSAVSWSCKAEFPVGIEQNLIHPENFEILNFCPRGGQAIASWNAFSETVRMNCKIKWCKICSFNLTIRSILSSNPVLRENLNFP